MNTKFISPRLGAVAGLIASIVFTAMWALAAITDGHWQLGRMTLSELGDRSRAGALLFNSGAIITGLLALLFALGLYRVLSTTTLGKVGSVTLAIGAVLLVGIGLFPIDTDEPHTVLSYSFFLMAAVSMTALIAPIWKSHVFHRTGGLLTAALLVIPLASIPFLPWAGVEALAVGCLLLWMAFISIRMLWHHPAA
jgi:hypothetical membrane protein